MIFRFSRKLLVVIATATLLGSLIGCRNIAERFDRTGADTNAVQTKDPNAELPFALLSFGNPSNASSDPANKDNYIVVHNSYILSYNESRGTLNWIAWRTARADLGGHLPRHLFEPDPALPAGFRRVAYYDYSGGDYDRGHMLPSADRFGDERLNAETFLMTNIVPQTADLNKFPWEKLESYARSLAFRGNELYEIAGVYGEKARLRNKVTVPTNCWKVIVVFPKVRRDNEISSGTRVIAVDMPNVDGIEAMPWETYKTTVRDIERKTGFDLFSSLPRELQEAIETQIDGK